MMSESTLCIALQNKIRKVTMLMDDGTELTLKGSCAVSIETRREMYDVSSFGNNYKSRVSGPMETRIELRGGQLEFSEVVKGGEGTANTAMIRELKRALQF
jgi:hypothetical protein